MKKIKKIIKKLIIILQKIFYHNRLCISLESANEKLNIFSENPNGVCFTENNIKEIYDLQVIIPAYNVQNYLEDCLRSVLEQKTKYSFEVILINDGSTDSTLEIAKRFTNYKNLKIIDQKNLGFSGARNTGLKNIDAKYIMFLDSDDMLCDNALDSLLKVAYKENADIVQAGHYLLTDSCLKDGLTFKYNKAVSSNNNLTGFPWGKIFKSTIFKNIKYPENFWFEDTIFSLIIYPNDYISVTIPEIVYKYRVRENNITNTANKKPKCIDTFWITEYLIYEYVKLGFKVDKKFFDLIVKQIIMNFRRTENVPKIIKKCIFIKTSKIISDLFDISCVEERYAKLYKYFIKKDWGGYYTFCKYFKD